VFHAKIFLVFGEKLIIHSYDDTPKQIISKYSAFKGAHTSNCNALSTLNLRGSCDTI